MKRNFEVCEMEMRSDGRTVEGRIIPYNEVTTIREIRDGKLEVFDEQFLPRSCLAMTQACKRRGNASFIAYLIDHDEEHLDARIGYASEIRDAGDGGYATFRLYEGRDLDKVRSMLNESHRGLSVNFADTRPFVVVDGIRSHVQIHVDHVAATATPAYVGAGITAMRDDEAVPVDLGTPALDDVTKWLGEYRQCRTTS